MVSWLLSVLMCIIEHTLHVSMLEGEIKIAPSSVPTSFNNNEALTLKESDGFPLIIRIVKCLTK